MFCRWLTTQGGLGEEEQVYANVQTLLQTLQLAKQAGRVPAWPVDMARHGFRMLTEAEWEVSCRAGTRTSWSFGEDVDLLNRYAWFGAKTEVGISQVRLKRPNPRGLFDMHGNVSEWCHDGYAKSYLEFSTKDPIAPEPKEFRVTRSGALLIKLLSCGLLAVAACS